MPRRSALLLLVVAILVTARDADALTLNLANQLGSSFISVRLTAVDCCASLNPINQQITFSDNQTTGSLDFVEVGTLIPMAEVQRFGVEAKPLSIEAMAGVVPITLAIEEARWQFSSEGVFLQRIPIGGFESFGPGVVDGVIRGSLTAGGTTIPFFFDEIPCTPCLTPKNGNSELTVQSTQLIQVSATQPGGGGPAPIPGGSQIEGPRINEILGEIDGVIYSLRVFPMFQGLVYVPEPTTASLLALGLVGMAATRRRRR